MLRYVLAALMLTGPMLAGGPALAEKAYVAGGCFWCVEKDFESVPGVREVVSGFMGGKTGGPTYASHGDHLEAVEIDYDPAKVSYPELMRLFLRSIDPTDAGGQFCDRGNSYRSAIFVQNGEERAAAEAAVAEAGKALGAAIVTPVAEAGTFYPVDEYHQDYYKSDDIILTRFGPKSKAAAYKLYRKGCGRDARVLELWGEAAPFAGH